MEKLVLAATARQDSAKPASQVRAEGQVPAVVYGHGVTSQAIAVDARELAKTYRQAGGNKIIGLKVGEHTPTNVLIHDVQYDGRMGHLLHADFYAVRMDEELEAEVPLHFVGESVAVYQQEGTLMKNLEAIGVRCLPGDLPESVEVDIAVLDDFEKTITVADLAVPKGVKFLIEDEETLVAKVEPPRSDAEMAELDEAVTEELPEGVVEEEPVVVADDNGGSKDR
jgi:large subunit ribosomal protein L25